MIETKVRILDAAERLFAEQGLDVSVRAITDEAGVNLAAVNYHFQSKDALVDAVIARRFEPVTRRRLEMLDKVEAQSGSGPLPLEPVLEAFFAPVIQPPAPGLEHLKPLMGRMYSMPDDLIKRLFHAHLGPVAARFTAALGRAVPELPESVRLYRLYFAAGAMVHLMNWSRLIPMFSNGLVDPTDTKALLDQLIAFAVAGFRAPVTPKPVEEETHV
ncbi:MAG TPA: TetR/AcrR family transcriptional regulator [Bryobacteraceae bacterium]|nr:TetR/AcrR family transcriptional regulator [Bryobacteraceae bacterium]